MSDKIKSLLDEVIEVKIKNLGVLDIGGEKKSTEVDDLATLYRLKIEETKNELELEEKRENRKRDEQLKREQLEEQVKDRYFRLGIAAAEIVLPLIFYALWMRKGFKFEETGTYTSTTFRGLFNRFKPTKK